jgi:hypothetical protein
MNLLPYVELPIHPGKTPVDPVESIEGLENSILDICHMMKNDERYFFQLGFYKDGGVYTSKEMIINAHELLINHILVLEDYLLEELKKHISIYCTQIKYVPAWGEEEYYDIIASGKTPRRLDGPHKGSNLGRAESRFVAIRDDKKMAYGPKLTYLGLLEWGLKKKSINLD